MKKLTEKVSRQQRVLARALAEKELKSIDGADTVLITQHGTRQDITDTNNNDAI